MSLLIRDGATIRLQDHWPTEDDLGMLVARPRPQRVALAARAVQPPGSTRGQGGQRRRGSLRRAAGAGNAHTGAMDDAVRDYIDAIAPEHRPLFDRPAT
jgi:hypothetical protein